MPIYEYGCPNCGNFSVLRKMAEFTKTESCPHCAANAQHIISAPHLTVLHRNHKMAYERNEKSAHEPYVHRCGSACTSHGSVAPAASARRRRRNGRPWMLG
jgi:putative FmdB family regulatory protein